jgi:hypothetical protein
LRNWKNGNRKNIRQKKASQLFASTRNINIFYPTKRIKQLGKKGKRGFFKEREKLRSGAKSELDYEIIETAFPLDFVRIFKNERKREKGEKEKKLRNNSLSRLNPNKSFYEKNSRLSHDSGSKGKKN